MKSNKAITKYWMQNYVTYFDDNAACSLCGNSGVIHTEGARTAAGVVVGRANYCICPNGQAMREQSGVLTQRAPDVCQSCGAKWQSWDEVLNPDLCAICGTRR